MSAVRLLIVAPHRLFRHALAVMCEQSGNFEVIGEVARKETAVRLARRMRPDLILIDVDSPVLDAAQVTRCLMQEDSSFKIIAIAATRQDPRVSQTLKAGARSCLLKESDEHEFVRSIEAVLEDRTCARYMKESSLDRPGMGQLIEEELTQGEMDVLRLVAHGRTNRDISEQLFLSERTVANRLLGVYQKLDINNRTQAALVALHSGLVELSSVISHEELAMSTRTTVAAGSLGNGIQPEIEAGYV